MPCVHLQQLYKVCHEHDLKFSSSDLIRIICPHCGEAEVCPSTLSDEYDAKQPATTCESADSELERAKQ
jgi:hypothetical protein